MLNYLNNNEWNKLLASEFEKPYFKLLEQKLNEESKKYTICPPIENVFTALNLTDFDQVKVVIIGQDPYHQLGQANGLSFSVDDAIKIPPSLQTVFKELANDLQVPISTSGNLKSWASQGVLLLNATLTVRVNEANSHKKFNWEVFTDAIIKLLSEKQSNIIFLLWGNFAQKKALLIDEKAHFILKAAHPSPLARGAFYGCKHFSKTNEILKKIGAKEIDWRIV